MVKTTDYFSSDILMETFSLISRGNKVNKRKLDKIKIKAEECCQSYGKTYSISDFFNYIVDNCSFIKKTGIISYLTSNNKNDITFLNLKLNKMIKNILFNIYIYSDIKNKDILNLYNYSYNNSTIDEKINILRKLNYEYVDIIYFKLEELRLMNNRI